MHARFFFYFVTVVGFMTKKRSKTKKTKQLTLYKVNILKIWVRHLVKEIKWGRCTRDFFFYFATVGFMAKKRTKTKKTKQPTPIEANIKKNWVRHLVKEIKWERCTRDFFFTLPQWVLWPKNGQLYWSKHKKKNWVRHLR